MEKLWSILSNKVKESNKITEEKVLEDWIAGIIRVLLQSDVDFKIVREIERKIKTLIKSDDLESGRNKFIILHQAIFSEICKILDVGRPSFIPKKRKPSVVMFVGLQGCGKTTTCTKYAYYHARKGWKPALVCADTFRAGAFDQLKHDALKARIPFYGSYTESDPVKLAVQGVANFKKKNVNLIIVDTRVCHKQDASLLEELHQVSEAIQPDLVIFVMDSRIGQAASNQAQAFKRSVEVGAVIVTKMEGHAKGGGALSIVKATKSPVIFIGFGEQMDALKEFDLKSFVSRLLGMFDWYGFMHRQPELLEKVSEGESTFRIMYEHLQNALKIGPGGQIPGFSKDHSKESETKLKHYKAFMDSMTNGGKF
ncbi:OLC1v1023932C1 [Oldenlandia corymbosa var. corymbosa]|uniref:signal-recognition-particle GTPase n=1 Tax=Oldenlandia corymbosa var. corymbosa TaxID=529605 RepID=A0AAV1C455_OLDCO|nr:OLC1v1023932C1 [Oldenlandia corymbosa var. corymbosa]